jgi:hypothetical protein
MKLSDLLRTCLVGETCSQIINECFQIVSNVSIASSRGRCFRQAQVLGRGNSPTYVTPAGRAKARGLMCPQVRSTIYTEIHGRT